MGVSRWTEWRARRDAVSAGVIRDWSLPDPEARGYGRGAVRVVELAFVRTRAVTQKVAAMKGERATRAERRREARRRAKEASRVVATTGAVEVPGIPDAPVGREELTSPIAGRLWEMVRSSRALRGFDRRGASAPESTAGVAAARAAVPEVE